MSFNEKKEEDSGGNPYQNLDKGQLLQEKRLFSDSPLNNRKCRMLISKLLYMLAQQLPPTTSVTGEKIAPSAAALAATELNRAEATDLFFATTKLFQSKDILLRREMYLLLGELVPRASDVIIMVSSLIKDMSGAAGSAGSGAFKASAIRLLSRVCDAQMMAQVDRYMRQSIVDKDPSVASAALVSGLHLMGPGGCPEVVKRWAGEVQEAAQSRSPVVQYHALGLLHAIKRHDRLAISKMIAGAGSSGVRAPHAQCMLLRFAKQVLLDDPAGAEGNKPVLQFIEQSLRHSSDMVVLEAARALCEIPNVPNKELASAVTYLQAFMTSGKGALRFAAVRTLNKLATTNPTLVSVGNPDLENLTTDSNRGVATLAITCLLKTGTEQSVDRLMKTISSFIGDVPDEFKILVVEALRTLCGKFEGKAKAMVAFLASLLREEGGYEFKTAIVRAIVSVFGKAPELKEPGLAHLCEFIEDCEYPALCSEILGVLAEEGPSLPAASRYVRYVYNRTVLENATVRAAAVAALAKFALRAPQLREKVITLLGRCSFDGEDEVRDRSVFFGRALENANTEEAYQTLPDLITPTLPVQADNLVSSLEEYLSGSADCAFDLSAVAANVLAAPSSSAVGPTGTAQQVASAAAVVSPTALAIGLGKSAIESKLAEIPALADLGKLWHVSATDVALTEKETEYVVSCRKFTYTKHVAFEFTITNTLEMQQLENVRVALTPLGKDTGLTVEKVVPAPVAAYGNPVVTYTIVAVPENVRTAKFSNVLKFIAKDVDTTTGEVAAAGSEDEYPLDDSELTVGDFMQPAFVASFEGEWERISDAGQSVQKYSLTTVKTLQDAVNESIALLGMAPAEGSHQVPAPGRKHILYLGGRFIGDIPVLARIRMGVDPSGAAVNMELTVRSAVPDLNALIANAI